MHARREGNSAWGLLQMISVITRAVMEIAPSENHCATQAGMPIEPLGARKQQGNCRPFVVCRRLRTGHIPNWAHSTVGAGKYEVKDRGAAPVACRILCGGLCESAWPRRSAVADPATEARLRPRLFHPAWRFGGCRCSTRDP